MTSSSAEELLTFRCGNFRLVGIVHRVAGQSHTGVVFIVGGPQYRVGSHRLYLHVARAFAAAGVPSLRFDYRGMGDSDGPPRCFDGIDEDIRAAIDALTEREPRVKQVCLWGLCDGASAALMYAPADHRVKKLVLVNPWVRTETTASQIRVNSYYRGRLLSGAMWSKLIRGQVNVIQSFREILLSVLQASAKPRSSGFLERMRGAASTFEGEVLLVLSGKDYTAEEFRMWRSDLADKGGALQEGRASSLLFQDADHTFSAPQERRRMEDACAMWITSGELR